MFFPPRRGVIGVLLWPFGNLFIQIRDLLLSIEEFISFYRNFCVPVHDVMINYIFKGALKDNLNFNNLVIRT